MNRNVEVESWSRLNGLEVDGQKAKVSDSNSCRAYDIIKVFNSRQPGQSLDTLAFPSRPSSKPFDHGEST